MNHIAGNSVQQTVADVWHVYKTMASDVPVASMRWALGMANDKDAMTAVWQGYDAGIRVATAAVDAWYRSPALSEMFCTTVNQVLRLHQLAKAANRLFVTSDGPSLPLPPVVQPCTTHDHMLSRLSTSLTDHVPPIPRRQTTTRRARGQAPVAMPVPILADDQPAPVET